MKDNKEKIFLSEEVITDLYNKGALKRNYEIPGTFTIISDLVTICKKNSNELDNIVFKKAEAIIPVNTTKDWIQEWRELFPKGNNNNTGVPYRGDKHLCLKNMIKFRKEYDFTKDEIFNITTKALKEAEKVNYEYFPAAHYFVHKQNTGSRLAQLGEIHREGGDGGRQGRRTVI
jgi:hypothetical protein